MLLFWTTTLRVLSIKDVLDDSDCTGSNASYAVAMISTFSAYFHVSLSCTCQN